ncbi:acyl-CoA dehydrogenase family protein [Gordonia sp. (in: high G+C Gram-positive bacteria)]|uniref:acyl-CoA dehydrogenase family protein n=1 Tax=Gordonia sp. (in: high G+C Gram-positive bacteria) TaxID=84139 RepID=UPI0026112747|nr:acyl-CoA dehydrogenase family protein [Gordonia sp. (in: high G+C Gram-positive bacteria)]
MNELDALGAAVRDAIARRGGRTAVREAITRPGRYDDELWRLLAGHIGVAALAVPEKYDGAGASLREAAVVVEALGESLAPVPMLSSAVVTTGTLLAAGDDDTCARLVPDLAAGTRTAALCWAGPAGWDAPGVTAEAGLLSGTAEYVIDGESADTFLVLAGPSRPTLHEVPADGPGVTVTPLPVLDATRPLARVCFDQTPAHTIGSPPGLPGRIRTLAWALLSAEQVGGAARALALTVEHTRTRKQFGRELASFQALKHAMADMYVLVETMRSMSAAAVAAASDDDPQAAELAAAAHVYCSEGYVSVTGQAIQLHGGIGITAEHDIGLYFKRAQADAQLFGSPRRALADIAV